MKKLRYAAVGAAMIGSGSYLFVYLYRWEWHRALVAGLLFVAAEVGLATAAILDRLRAMEQRLDGSPHAGAAPDPAPVLRRIEEVAPGPRTNFEWLSQQGSGVSVFVPLLLGAGVVMSGAAWVVERAARVTARPAFERGLALRLAPFTLPVGAFAGGPATPVAPRRPPLVAHVAVVVAAVLAATVGLDALGDATQDRPDTLRHHTASSVVVSIASRPERPVLEATQALWGACTTQLGRRHRVVAMTDMGGGRVQVLVRPEIAKYAERRLRGCVADGTTDRIQARVVGVTLIT